MKRTNKIAYILGLLFSITMVQVALADKFFYRVNNPVERDGFYSARAGKIVYVDSTFDDANNIFKFEVLFEPSPDTSNVPGLLPVGFFLAMNAGNNPKIGHLAAMYFDARTISSPKITLYGYNNRGNDSSWQCGNYAPPDSEVVCAEPDRIISNVGNGASWVRQLYVEDLISIAGPNQRRFYMELDVSDVINHTPLYGNPADWFGIGFKHQVGVWFHPIPEGLIAEYGYPFPANSFLRRGQFLIDWSTQKTVVHPGYYDTVYEIATDCAGNPRYKKDNNGNGYPLPPIVKEDICGVCGGDGSTCATPTPTPTATPTPPPVGCDGVPGSGKVIDKCGICGGNGDCTANCDRTDITVKLLSLDGSGNDLLKTVRASAKTLVKFGGKKQNKFAKAIVAKAEREQNSVWIAGWSYGTIILSCPASASCNVRSFAANAATVNRGLKAMEALNRKLTAKLSRLGSSTAKKKAIALNKKGVSFLKKGVLTLGTLPASSGICYPVVR